VTGSQRPAAGLLIGQIEAAGTTLVAGEPHWISDWLRRSGFDALLGVGPFDLMWWQWMALLGSLAVAWGGGRILGALTRAVLSRVSAHTTTAWDDRLLASVGPPIRLAWLLFIFAIVAHSLGLPAPAETTIWRAVQGLSVATIFWALWRSIGVIIELLLSRPWAAANASTRHLLAIGGNLSKGVIAVLGILALLAALGYPVTTLLAGLGIGGLAFAFGAQKTVENLFGSMALAVDQPFRVGDFVRVGDLQGTVEDIGLRSTRFRTPDRTLVSIPNGTLADQRLESLAERDRMRLATTVSLVYGTTRAQMGQVLEGLERALRSHPKVWPGPVVVAFKQLGESSLDIEIQAWFEVPADDFNRCRQEVLLEFMRVVEEAGTAFALPARAVQLVGAASDAAAPARA
jgi:MscS family membrane protein